MGVEDARWGKSSRERGGSFDRRRVCDPHGCLKTMSMLCVLRDPGGLIKQKYSQSRFDLGAVVENEVCAVAPLR